MSEALRVSGDLVVAGAILGATQIQQPAGSIVDADVSPSAAIAASKCQRSIAVLIPRSGTAVDETLIGRVIKGTNGTLKHFTCSNVVTCTGGSKVTVDLQKNGVTCLAAPVELNVGTGDLGEEVGILTVTSLVDGDVLTVVIDATLAYGTDALASGVFAQIDLDEAYAL